MTSSSQTACSYQNHVQSKAFFVECQARKQLQANGASLCIVNQVRSVFGLRRFFFLSFFTISLFSGYLLSTSTRHAQSPLPPYLHPVENATIRDAYFADEQVRTAHNMLHSDGLIDFRSIVRIEPPKDSLEEAFERENTESWETSGANTKLGITLQHLTDSQFVVVLSSDEIVWLEVRATLSRDSSHTGQQCLYLSDSGG